MSSTKNKIVLKKLKELDTIWHPESKLVFKSSKDKVVIGRYENDELISLDDECLELCAKWKFKYDKDLVQEEEDEEDDDYEKVDETTNENLDTKEHEDEDDYEKVQENIETNTNNNEKNNEHTKIVNNTDKSKTENITNQSISDITNEYTKCVHEFFDYLSQKYNDELLNLKNEIIQKNKLYDELLNNYNKEVTEHSNTTEDLNKLKTKFDGIKQLFSI
jgi:hypothetical protein